MTLETALKHFRNWRAREVPVLVVLETGGVKLSSAAGVSDVSPTGVSFTLPGEHRGTMLVSFEGAVFEEATIAFPNMALTGLVVTLPHSGTCAVQEVWRVGRDPDGEPEDHTGKVQ